MKKLFTILMLLTGSISAQFSVSPTAISASGPPAGTLGTTSISVNWTFQAPNTGGAVSATYNVNGTTATVACVKSGVGNPRTYTCPASAISLSWSTASCGTGTGTDTSTYSASATTTAPAPQSPIGGPSTITVNCGTALAINAIQVDAAPTENGYYIAWNALQNVSQYEVQVGNQGIFKTVATTSETEFDLSLSLGGFYEIKINALDVEGNVVGTKTVRIEKEMPKGYALSDIYPNPFEQSANFELNLENAQNLKLTVVNVLGQTVATVYEGKVEAQSAKHFAIDAQYLTSGAYLLVIEGETFKQVKSFNVLK